MVATLRVYPGTRLGIAMHGRDAAGEPLVGLVAAIQRYDAVAKHSPANRDRVVVALALFARHR